MHEPAITRSLAPVCLAWTYAMVDDARGDALAAILAEGGDGSPLRVCHAGVAALPIDGAAFTMMTDPDRQEPVCASDETAGRIDEQAFASGQSVLIPDLREQVDRRLPVFSLQPRPRRPAAEGADERAPGGRRGHVDTARPTRRVPRRTAGPRSRMSNGNPEEVLTP